MPFTVNTKTYALDTIGTSTATYTGPAKTGSAKDDLKTSRQLPKASSTYSGNARAKAQLTRTSNLMNAKTPTGDLLFVGEVSVPVGTPDADIDTMCADAAAFIGSAEFKTLVKKGTYLKP